MPQTRQKFPPRANNLHYHEGMPADPDGAPPFLGTWKRVYTAIFIYLAALISAFYLFTRAHR
jgi:hypothetical protein